MNNYVTSVPAALIALAAISMSTPATAQNHEWWGCPAEHELETHPTRPQVRCIKRPQTQYRPISCPDPGLGSSAPRPVLVEDRQGTADACVVGDSSYAAEPLCARGYRLEVQPGADRCALHVPGSIVAPERLLAQ